MGRNPTFSLYSMPWTLVFVNDEYVGWGLFAFFSLAYVITALIVAIIFIARLSDIYLDDKLEIEE